ncbi:hypothetical protein KR51_00036550 [Rubidibacter lacunae KORDI 51-2]|uniref:Uncharacterized protein n=1 Tax=Rubidibacter lacunae KORDI 51-2 TaxID=582515 RepID=U5DEZ5_9CHRO|nr:hypothetical protein [Rubidibacter lacunae]ERN39872.1 hypothetical protein KR51_00036550 [Rubidibacter lacunae KORDI 51-2]
MSLVSNDWLGLKLNEGRLCIENNRLPLAVYREATSQLRQIAGADVELLPQRSLEFEYRQSQVGGLCVHCPEMEAEDRNRLLAILDYYAQRYGAWRLVTA